MLRMSKLTDYGTMVLAQLAASDAGWTTAGQVADATHLGPADRQQAAEVARSRGARRVEPRRPGRLRARSARPPRSAPPRSSTRSKGPVAITECSSSQRRLRPRVVLPRRHGVAAHQHEHSQSARGRQPRGPANAPRASAQSARRSPRSRGGTVRNLNDAWPPNPKQLADLVKRKYRHGFVTDIEQDTVPPGLNEDVDSLDLRQEGRARVPHGMAAQGLSALAHA